MLKMGPLEKKNIFSSVNVEDNNQSKNGGKNPLQKKSSTRERVRKEKVRNSIHQCRLEWVANMEMCVCV